MPDTRPMAPRKPVNGVSDHEHAIHRDDEDGKEMDRVLIKLDGLADLIRGFVTVVVEEMQATRSDQVSEFRAQNVRLADDQRRLWETTHQLQNQIVQIVATQAASSADESKSRSRLHVILVTVSSLASASIATVVAHFIR